MRTQQMSIVGDLATARWRALGTTVVLRLTDPWALVRARTSVEHELDAIDRACSRFRPDSDLSRVNASDGRPTPVSPLLIEALVLALRAARLTAGDVDPTVGRALLLAGYDRDWRLLEPPAQSDSLDTATVSAHTVSAHTRWRAIELDPNGGRVRIPPGVRLDLGATAKAWAADRAARAVYDATGAGVLVSLGGDIATAGLPPVGGWQIHVTDDHRSAPTAPGQTVSIHSGGLATSSTTVRRWSHRGRTMHHIIDPTTGMPVREIWRTVSVAATSCLDANIATTATFVKAGAAPAWLARLGVPARLVNRAGRVYLIGDWPSKTTNVPRPISPDTAPPTANATNVARNFVGRAIAESSCR